MIWKKVRQFINISDNDKDKPKKGTESYTGG